MCPRPPDALTSVADRKSNYRTEINCSCMSRLDKHYCFRGSELKLHIAAYVDILLKTSDTTNVEKPKKRYEKNFKVIKLKTKKAYRLSLANLMDIATCITPH